MHYQSMALALGLIVSGLPGLPSQTGELEVKEAKTGAVEAVRPPLTPIEWTRIRKVSQALTTDEGTRKLYKESPALGEAFPMETNFIDLAGKWRPRISLLPMRWEDSAATDVAVMHKEDDGIVVYYLTYHHAGKANAITILKTVWREDALLNLSFMKGFDKIPFNRGPQASEWRPRRY